MTRPRPLPSSVYVAVTVLPVAGAAWMLARHDSPVLAAVICNAAAALAVVVLERWRPFSRAWLAPRQDVRVDLTHLVVDSLLAEALLRALAILVVAGLPTASRLWPMGWPLGAQLAAALVIFELVQYVAHRAMHRVPWLWAFHAVHHSPERLHLPSTFRNHPVDSILTVALPLAPIALLGASEDLLVLTGIAVSVHAMVQHSNVDFRPGAVDFVLSTARLHRWHHSRTLAEAETNYGGTLIVWDSLFGTRHAPERAAGEAVGLADGSPFPATYVGQLLYPVRRSKARAAVSTR